MNGAPAQLVTFKTTRAPGIIVPSDRVTLPQTPGSLVVSAAEAQVTKNKIAKTAVVVFNFIERILDFRV